MNKENTYVDNCKNDLADSKDTRTFADGAQFIGELKCGIPNGKGTFSYANGDKYIGRFKDDKRINGTTYDKYGNIIVKYQNGIKRTPMIAFE